MSKSDEIAALCAHRDVLQRRVDTLNELAKFADHRPGCPFLSIAGEECTCGFAAVLNAVPWTREQEQTRPVCIRRTINFYGGPETFDKGERLVEQVVSLLRANGFEVTWSIGGAE